MAESSDAVAEVPPSAFERGPGHAQCRRDAPSDVFGISAGIARNAQIPLCELVRGSMIYLGWSKSGADLHGGTAWTPGEGSVARDGSRVNESNALGAEDRGRNANGAMRLAHLKVSSVIQFTNDQLDDPFHEPGQLPVSYSTHHACDACDLAVSASSHATQLPKERDALSARASLALLRGFDTLGCGAVGPPGWLRMI